MIYIIILNNNNNNYYYYYYYNCYYQMAFVKFSIVIGFVPDYFLLILLSYRPILIYLNSAENNKPQYKAPGNT